MWYFFLFLTVWKIKKQVLTLLPSLKSHLLSSGVFIEIYNSKNRSSLFFINVQTEENCINENKKGGVINFEDLSSMNFKKLYKYFFKLNPLSFSKSRNYHVFYAFNPYASL